MSARVFQVLSTGDAVDPVRRHRQWLDVGDPFVVAGRIFLMLIEQGRDPWFQVFTRAGKDLGSVPLAPMDFSKEAPYRVIPRAVRMHPNGLPEAVLIETQYTGTKRPAWENQQEDNCNANFQSIPDAG